MRATLAAFVVTFYLFAVMFSIGHCAPTSNRPNSIGADKLYVNPYSYRLALPIDGQVLEGKYTNIRFWPYATPELYDETILFCGDVTSFFDGKSHPVVMTYRTQASHMYKGIPCHDLISVFEVNAK